MPRNHGAPRTGLIAMPLGLIALVPVIVHAQSVDYVRKNKGTVSGTIVSVSPTKVVVKRGGVRDVPIDVREIQSIAFAGEPQQLNHVRQHLDQGRFEEAKKELAKVDSSKIKRSEIKQDLQFYQALSAVRLALSTGKELERASKRMHQFISKNPKSYHFFDACEALGDALVRRGAYDQAAAYYAKLEEAPWPNTKLRSLVRVGEARQQQGKFDDAMATFDEALQMKARTDETKLLRQSATLGKATCLAATDKSDAAIELIQGVIAEADPEDADLHAAAYNALGNCHLKAKQSPEAILAFLHVDVLYSSAAEAHAEALAKLTELWQAVGKEDRARETKELLKERYPSSVWTQ